MGIFSKFKRKKHSIGIDIKNKDGIVFFVSPKKMVKLDTEIDVPNDFCAVILCKEKLCDEICSGTFKLNGLTCPLACKRNNLDKPTKKGYKKEFYADFYFVYLEKTNIFDEFFIKKLKKQISYSLDFKIENPKKFLKFLFLEKIVFENDFAKNEINFYASQLVYYYFLDNKVAFLDDLKNHITKKLEEIGAMVLDFSLFEKDCNDQVCDENFVEEKTCPSDEENFVQKNASVYDLAEIKTENVAYFVCDGCGAKLAKGTEKCFMCGKSFVEENVCENCGHILAKGECVCPNCHCLIVS